MSFFSTSHRYDATPDSVLQSLIGDWRFDREIPDRAIMYGKAVFSDIGQGEILYREDGILTLTAYSSEFFKEYIYRNAPGGFLVCFAETPRRLFHQVTLTRGAVNAWHGEAEHQCLSDHYSSSYSFFDDERFSITHKVQGKRKDYITKTFYSRPG